MAIRRLLLKTIIKEYDTTFSKAHAASNGIA
jgi:hypothetical protein